MLEMQEVQTAAETLGRAFEEYKSSNDQKIAELERRGSADVLHGEKLARIDQAITKLQDDVSGVKTALRRPGSPVASAAAPVAAKVTAEDSEHKQAFMRYVTKGIEQDLTGLESKASVLSDPDGGYSVPTELSARIVSRQFDTTPMRQVATVMNVSTDALDLLRDTNEAEALWVSELATRSDTDQGAIGRIRIPVFELHAQPKATQKLLDDAVINVEEWMIAKVGDRFARRENAAFVNGDGVTQPRGFTSYATVATGDASRSWGVLEHVVTAQDGGFAASNPADCLIALMHKLKAGYLPKAAWFMPRAVAELIRKFKEATTNAYIWQPGLQAGTPATLLGFPIYLAEDMPAPATGSLSVAFGNFNEGYVRHARAGLTITPEEAEQFLAADLAAFARDVEHYVKVPLTDNQFAALVSFAFNVGTANFIGSKLLRLLNRGWYEQVPAQLMKWTYARGEQMGGLARRRAAEARLWNASDQ